MQENYELLKKAKKKISVKAKPNPELKKQEQMLQKQKDVAIAILKDSAVYKQDQELVHDDTFNKDLVVRIDAVSLKID